jgi:hypothetical protein
VYSDNGLQDAVVGLGGGVAQVETVVQGTVAVVGAGPGIVSAFTNTGITAPVLREKAR